MRLPNLTVMSRDVAGQDCRPFVPYQTIDAFDIKGSRRYAGQYSDLYFLRLARLKSSVEEKAHRDWDSLEIAGEQARSVERVLDVRQGELVWVAGTIFADLPLKPNILEEISHNHWNEVPPARAKYKSPNGVDVMMLEDESGRLRLSGKIFSTLGLVTGCVVAVLGTENREGEFETIDLRVPDLAPQLPRWSFGGRPTPEQADVKRRRINPESGKQTPLVAIVSGLGIQGETGSGLMIDLLESYLLGELAHHRHTSKRICRLLLVGNSIDTTSTSTYVLDPLEKDLDGMPRKKQKATVARKYGYDSSAYNPLPTAELDSLLYALLPSIPITILPGVTDPSNHSLPQQPLHPALFARSRQWGPDKQPAKAPEPPADYDGGPPSGREYSASLHSTTNPASFSLNGFSFLAMASQTVDDVLKYIDLPSSSTRHRLDQPSDHVEQSDADPDSPNSPTEATAKDRLVVMERMLRWRCIAPTAPDTLPCYPYQDIDPFVIERSPHVLISGGGAQYGSTVIQARPDDYLQEDTIMQETNVNGEEQEEINIRLITVPDFRLTGVVALCDIETLECSRIVLGAWNESHEGVPP